MRRSPRSILLGRPDEPVGRIAYVRLGASLMLLKYIVDAGLIWWLAGVVWTPLDYLLPMITFNGRKTAAFPRALNIVLVLWALPFIWAGVTLSVRRGLDARIFPGVVVLFFVPLLNSS